MKNNVLFKLAFIFLLVFIQSGSVSAASPSAELRASIDSLAGVKMNTAQLDNAVLCAYEVFRPKLGLAPVNLSAEMRFKGFDVSKLVKFADELDKSPTRANRDAASALIAAARAANELAGVSYLLSDDVFIAGYAASSGAFSLAMKFGRVTPASLMNPAAKEKVRKLAFNVTRGTIGLLASYLPERVSKFMPVCLWITGDVCARSLGLASSVNWGVRDASIKTAGRIVMAFTPEIGFYARAQRMIDELGDAALNSKLPALNPGKKSAIDKEIQKIKDQVEKIRSLASKERTAALLTRTLAELSSLFAAVDPTKITAGLAAGSGALSAGVYFHAFYAPLKKYNGLTEDMRRILNSLREDGVQLAPAAEETFTPDPAVELAIAQKQRKIAELIKRYTEASFELAELADNSSGQKEFFLKMKELEQLDYQIGVLSLSK